MRKFFTILGVFLSVVVFGQTSKRIGELYDKLNILKIEQKRIERFIDEQIGSKKLSKQLQFRRELIINNQKNRVRGIESSIEIIPSVEGEESKQIWIGKIGGMIIEAEEDFNNSMKKGGWIEKLLYDIDLENK